MKWLNHLSHCVWLTCKWWLLSWKLNQRNLFSSNKKSFSVCIIYIALLFSYNHHRCLYVKYIRINLIIILNCYIYRLKRSKKCYIEKVFWVHYQNIFSNPRADPIERRLLWYMELIMLFIYAQADFESRRPQVVNDCRALVWTLII